MGADRDSLAAEAFADSNVASATSGDLLPGALASLDSTLPPTPLRDLLAADGATIFVLSSDRDLTQAVEHAGGEQYPIHVVVDWAELVDAAAARRTHIVLLDADALPVALPQSVEALHEAAPVLVVLIAASRETAQPLMSLLSERKIHRLLIKPAAEGITRLLLDSAIARYLQLREHHEPPIVLVDEDRLARRYRAPRASWSPWLLATGLVMATVAALIVGELYGVRWDGPADRMIASPPAGEPRNEVSVETPAGPVEIGRDDTPADDARAETTTGSRLDPELSTTPFGEPEPSTAAQLPEDDAGSTEPAPDTRLSADIRRTEQPAPDTRLSADIRRTEPTPSLEPAGDAEAEGELDALFGLIDARLADGRLLTPEGDSAMAHFERAVALRPNDPRVLSRRTAIAAGLVEVADAALERGDLDAAQRLSGDAFRFGAELEDLARLDGDLTAARRAQTIERHSQLLSAATALLREGRLIDPDGEGALGRLAALRRERSPVPGLAAAWRDLTAAVASNVDASIDTGDFEAAQMWAAALSIEGGDPERAAELQAAVTQAEVTQAEFLAMPVPAGELRLIESPPLVYPTNARIDGTEGWVDLEFVVDREGRTRDITIVDSRPGSHFADAAIEAVAGQRYEPFVFDGRIYERRARLRIRFDLE